MPLVSLIVYLFSFSIAKSLGSLTITATSLEYYNKYKIINACVHDRDTVNAILQFSGEFRLFHYIHLSGRQSTSFLR